MKKQALLFFALLCPIAGQAQGVFLPPRTVFGTVNGITRPIAGATVTVCGPNTAGIPCSPALANAVFKDSGLQTPLANPFTTDSNGNYPQVAIAGGNYTITESAPGFAGFSSQVTVSCAPGGSCAVTNFTATSIGGLLYVGSAPGAYPTIAAAETACGVNQCTVVIPPTYVGTDCPATGANTKQNIFHIDYRASATDGPGGQGGTVCSGNTMTFNGSENSGLVHSGFRNIWTFLNPAVSTTGGFNQCFYGGTTIGSNITIACGTTETDVIGNYASIPNSVNLMGHEDTLNVNILGSSTVNNAYVHFFAAGAASTNTATINNMYTGRAAAFNLGAGSPHPVNVIGWLFDNQTAGSGNNWGFENQGVGMFDCSLSGQQCLQIKANTSTNRNTMRVTNIDGGGGAGDWIIGDGSCTGSSAGNGQFQFCNVNVGAASFTALKNTGTAGAIFSSAPTANRTYTFPDLTSGVPVVFSCGSTGSGNQTCAPAAATTKTQIYNGESTLAANAATITFPNGFTSATSYFCVANDVTTRANPVQMVPASATTATITNTTGATDVIQWMCVGQ